MGLNSGHSWILDASRSSKVSLWHLIPGTSPNGVWTSRLLLGQMRMTAGRQNLTFVHVPTSQILELAQDWTGRWFKLEQPQGCSNLSQLESLLGLVLPAKVCWIIVGPWKPPAYHCMAFTRGPGSRWHENVRTVPNWYLRTTLIPSHCCRKSVSGPRKPVLMVFLVWLWRP